MEMKDLEFLKVAIDLAIQNVKNGLGGPFGAVIVKDNEIIATGTNLVPTTNDPTAHAEITAIRNACSKLNSFQLENCTIYSSCEPCPMCLGAIYWSRPIRLVFAASKFDAANAGFDDSFIYDEMKLPYNQREIKTINFDYKDKNKPFEVWKNIENKIKY